MKPIYITTTREREKEKNGRLSPCWWVLFWKFLYQILSFFGGGTNKQTNNGPLSSKDSAKKKKITPIFFVAKLFLVCVLFSLETIYNYYTTSMHDDFFFVLYCSITIFVWQKKYNVRVFVLIHGHVPETKKTITVRFLFSFNILGAFVAVGGIQWSWKFVIVVVVMCMCVCIGSFWSF